MYYVFNFCKIEDCRNGGSYLSYDHIVSIYFLFWFKFIHKVRKNLIILIAADEKISIWLHFWASTWKVNASLNFVVEPMFIKVT